ncbi:hypothetical protein F4809DRAFT_658632 [Biscogniauxia mediterranea]|nr:hypothetical protein F4809DRAFT_658632 [Biscogniauxia mediterranea]
MAATPYWGKLPTAKPRRSSGEYTQHDRRQSLDGSASTSQPQPRSNRVSVQTTTTDPYTDYSLSPLASPTASNLPDNALAPRPPSFPYGQNRYPPELLEKRRARAHQDMEDNFHGAAASPPPAAPDIPRAPPLSYKDPHGNGEPAYTYNAAGQPGPPRAYRRNDPPMAASSVDPDFFYTDATPPADRRGKAPVLDRGQQRLDNTVVPTLQLDRGESLRRSATGERPETRRRPSAPAEQQRTQWADDRSPLQRLELTLDSITKEEKRARVEAAERRARERAARAASAGAPKEPVRLLPEPPVGQAARSKSRHIPAAQEGERQAVVTSPIQAQPSAAAGGGSPLDVPGHRRVSSGPAGPSQLPVAKNRNVPKTEQAGLPQRNLSFRERAASNDLSLSRETGQELPSASVETSALARAGSNKLKKPPPDDPRYVARKEAEEKVAAILQRQVEMGSPHAPPSTTRQPIKGSIMKPPPPEDLQRPMTGYKQPREYGSFQESPVRAQRYPNTTGLGRSNSMGPARQPLPLPYEEPSQLGPAPGPSKQNGKSVKFPEQHHETRIFHDDYSDASSLHSLGFRDYIHRDKLKPGQGMYQPPTFLDEWKKATVGTLSGPMLDIGEEPVLGNTTWWESDGRQPEGMASRPQKAEAFDGEYDDSKAPTRFKPPLFLKCGPLMRYCGIRRERPLTRVNRNGGIQPDREIWRGSVMIVTQDAESSYDIVPILRFFVQPIELLPPPPAEVRGGQSLLPEYVDPIAGIPKLGRRGETLYVRPIEHLEEAKDVSMLDPDDGLFEITRSTPDFDTEKPDPPGSFASRKRRIEIDGEKVGKYKDVRGFRLHAERGHTFWRFNIEVELRDKQQRIAYRINRGPTTGFWVPARNEAMNIMFHSCNGFSLSVNPDELSGPDPMWRDVLNNHQTRPFHVMIGGGDQIYNDAVMRDTRHFQEWLMIKNPLHKNNAPFTPAMQDELEEFYLERYMMWFSRGLFGLANSQIPMVNMYDDHDIIDGFGSYPHHFMRSPVFSGLGNVAFKYYMLFQHQSLPDETHVTEPSWILGAKPGPYINERSRSLFMSLGKGVALLAVDCRTERTRDEVVREDTWKALMDRCSDEIIRGDTHHLLVLLGVPIAYPRLVWLENILTSRLMDPIKALGKTGMLGNFLNHFDGGVEVLDDLDDHWTAKSHKEERRYVIEDLQDLAGDLSVRVTILSGDVHLAAVGQFYSNPKLHLAKHNDFRYIPNIISSAIANAPPPDLMADILNKRNKVHHFDKETDEDMIPLFTHGVDGKPRNNKHLLPHRNWCSIRQYVPGQTPPPTPSEEYEYTPEATPRGSRTSLLRRFSLSKSKGPAFRPDAPKEPVDRSRPPISGGILRSFSRRSSSTGPAGKSTSGKLMRTLSLGRGDSLRRRSLFGRRSMDTPGDGGINGSWGPDGEEDIYDASPDRARHPAFASEDAMGLRGGAGSQEYEVGDDAYFTARPPRRAFTQPAATARASQYDDYSPDREASTSRPPAPHPFRRAPTDLNSKTLKKNAERYQVDLEGGLDICLNVEVNAKDPAGITVPYRLLVPRLWYEYHGEDGEEDADVGNPLPPPAAPPAMAMEEEGLESRVSGFDADSVQSSGGDVGEERRGGGGIKRWFSGRGSQYRARRSSQ